MIEKSDCQRYRMITAILWSGAADVADNGFCYYLDGLPLLTTPNLL